MLKMGDFLRGECPHCGQSIEYPVAGTGATVPCPTCEQSFVLKSVAPPPVSAPVPVIPEAAVPPPLAVKVAQVAAPVSATPPAPEVAAPVTPAVPAAKVAPVPPGPSPLPPAPVSTPPSMMASAFCKIPPPAAAAAARSKSPENAPLEQAIAEFRNDPAFASQLPTRDQVARAWAYAKFKQEEEDGSPSHADVVGALKKMFVEFRSSKPVLTHSRSRRN